MSWLSRNFGDTAKPVEKSTPRKKRPSPISLRLPDHELTALRKAAAGRSINGYIRESLFGDAAPIDASKPVREDHAALARVLGALGQSDIYTRLAAISLAIEQNRVSMDRETAASVREACDTVVQIRADLLIALGLRKV